MRHNRATELQLHRTVSDIFVPAMRCKTDLTRFLSALPSQIMELLRELRPADIMGFSCLVSALAELCFSIHHCYVPYPVAATPSACEGSPAEESLVVPLGAVDDKLRAEAGTHLLSLLRPSSSSAAPQKPVPPSSTAAIVEVICRRFVMDICEQPLQLRVSSPWTRMDSGGPQEGQGEGGDVLGGQERALLTEFVEQLCGRSTPSPNCRPVRGSVGAADKEVPPSPGKGATLGASFFSSLGMMMSSSSPSTAPSPATAPSQLSLRKFAKLPLHLGSSSVRGLPSEPGAPGRWSCFHALDMELQVLSAVMEVRKDDPPALPCPLAFSLPPR